VSVFKLKKLREKRKSDIARSDYTRLKKVGYEIF